MIDMTMFNLGLPAAVALAAAFPPQGTDREAFAAALPRLRDLAAAEQWEELARVLAPFVGMQPRLDVNRTEHEFPFHTDCSTCRVGEDARRAALRARIQAAAAGKAK